MRIGTAVAEARGGGVNETGIPLVQAVPAVAELFHRPRSKVLDQRVGLVEQPLEDLASIRRFEVERDRLLAAVDRDEVGRFAVAEWSVLAGIITVRGRLDLDHA